MWEYTHSLYPYDPWTVIWNKKTQSVSTYYIRYNISKPKILFWNNLSFVFVRVLLNLGVYIWFWHNEFHTFILLFKYQLIMNGQKIWNCFFFCIIQFKWKGPLCIIFLCLLWLCMFGNSLYWLIAAMIEFRSYQNSVLHMLLCNIWFYN